MNTSHTSPSLKFLDTAPLVTAYEGLCGLMVLRLSQGHYRGLLKLTSRIRRAVRSLISAERHNQRLELKLRMLLSPIWRERVLRDLGGEAALLRWERRVFPKVFIRKLNPHASPAQRKARAANLAKARLANKEKHIKRYGSLWGSTAMWFMIPLRSMKRLSSASRPSRAVNGL